jgi:hypothetical protein
MPKGSKNKTNAKAVKPTEIKINEKKDTVIQNKQVKFLILIGVVLFCCLACCFVFVCRVFLLSKEWGHFADENLDERCDKLREVYKDRTDDLFWYCN